MSKARPVTSKFFTIGHYNPDTGRYAAGTDDYYFITFCVVLFTGLRAGCMEHILAPLAKMWGISKRKEVTRFSEQAWLLIYYSVFWPLGWVSPLPCSVTPGGAWLAHSHPGSTCIRTRTTT